MFRHPIITSFFIVFSTLLFGNPENGIVIEGNASFHQAGQRLEIQSGHRTIIDWSSFSIDPGELTQFIQSSNASAVLNRVTGLEKSVIDGLLSSNGHVFLVNKNGILIGKEGVIDVNGFIGSTLNLSNDQFLNGKDLTFRGNSKGSVINTGKIHAATGDVFLIGYQVENLGTITAPEGTVGLGQGGEVLIAISGEERLFIRSPIESQEGSISSEGIIKAAEVEIKASKNPFTLAIKHGGEIEASGVKSRNGRVFLIADESPVQVTGSITARSGEVQVLGNEVELSESAFIDVSGDIGGAALIGGDYRGLNPEIQNADATYVAPGAKICADGLKGDGGKVIIWGNDKTHYFGEISSRALGELGDGGFVEISAKSNDYLFSGPVDASSKNGQNGMLLLDPVRIRVNNGGTENPSFPTTAPGTYQPTGVNTTRLYPSSFVPVLNGGTDVTIDSTGSGGGTGDIDFESAFSWSGSGNLIVNAARDVEFLADVTSTGTGSFSATANRRVFVTANDKIETNSGDIVLIGLGNGGVQEGIEVDGSIVSTSGNITLTGTSASSGAVAGVQIDNAGSVTSNSPSGAIISITGISQGGSNGSVGVDIEGTVNATDAASINIIGTGSNQVDDNYGVHVTGSVSTASGALSLNGTGNSAATGTHNVGVYIEAGGSVSSTSNTVSITGTGGGGTSDNHGLELTTTGTISSNNGLILDGTSTSGIVSHGVFIPVGVTAATLATAPLSITGDATLAGSGDGIHLSGGVTSPGGLVTLNGDGSFGGVSYGVFIDGTVSVTDSSAAISIDGTANGSGENSDGVRIQGSITATNAATITITGEASTSAGQRSDGVDLVEGTVSAVDGLITMTGNSFAAGLESGGVEIHWNSSVSSTGSGGISIHGTGSPNGTDIAHGLKMSGINIGPSNISTVDGDLTIVGIANGTGTTCDGFDLGSFSSVDLGSYIESTGNGNISITGTGGGGAAGDNLGIRSFRGLEIRATGAGNIGLNGQGGLGSLGYGVGISAASTVTTLAGSGNISINGTAGTGSGNNYGVMVTDANTIISTAGGSLSLDGTGGNGGGGSHDVGAYVVNGGTLSSIGGIVSITGQGGMGTSLNHGIEITSTGIIDSLAGLALDGTSTHGTDSRGVFLPTGTSALTAGTGAISITGVSSADSGSPGVEISGTVSSLGSGSVIINGTSSGTAANSPGIIVASTNITSGTGQIELTGIGNTGATLSEGIDIQSSSAITSSGGNIILTGTGQDTSGSPIGIDVNSSAIETTLTGTAFLTTTAGDIVMDGTSTVTTQGGDVTLLSEKHIFLGQVDASFTGNIFTTATNGNITKNTIDPAVNLTGANGYCKAGTGIGASGLAIRTTLLQFQGDVTGTGDLYVFDTAGGLNLNAWNIAGNSVQTSSGLIDIESAAGNLTITAPVVATTDLNLRAPLGSIVNNSGANTPPILIGNAATLSSLSGIGSGISSSSTAIGTQIDLLVADVTGTGDVVIHEQSGLDLGNINSILGTLDIDANGPIAQIGGNPSLSVANAFFTTSRDGSIGTADITNTGNLFLAGSIVAGDFSVDVGANNLTLTGDSEVGNDFVVTAGSYTTGIYSVKVAGTTTTPTSTTPLNTVVASGLSDDFDISTVTLSTTGAITINLAGETYSSTPQLSPAVTLDSTANSVTNSVKVTTVSPALVLTAKGYNLINTAPISLASGQPLTINAAWGSNFGGTFGLNAGNGSKITIENVLPSDNSFAEAITIVNPWTTSFKAGSGLTFQEVNNFGDLTFHSLGGAISTNSGGFVTSEGATLMMTSQGNINVNGAVSNLNPSGVLIYDSAVGSIVGSALSQSPATSMAALGIGSGGQYLKLDTAECAFETQNDVFVDLSGASTIAGKTMTSGGIEISGTGNLTVGNVNIAGGLSEIGLSSIGVSKGITLGASIGDIIINEPIIVGDGNVEIQALTGAIIRNIASLAVNLTATNGFCSAASGIGTFAAPILTTLTNFQGQVTGSGNLYVASTGGLNLTNWKLGGNSIQTSSGLIDIESTVGNLVVSNSVEAGGNGTVDLRALAGNFTMDPLAQMSTEGEDITLFAQNSVGVSQVNAAPSGTIKATAQTGDITDTTLAVLIANFIGNEVILEASAGIGSGIPDPTSTTDISTQTNFLTASTTTNDIVISDLDNGVTLRDITTENGGNFLLESMGLVDQVSGTALKIAGNLSVNTSRATTIGTVEVYNKVNTRLATAQIAGDYTVSADGDIKLETDQFVGLECNMNPNSGVLDKNGKQIFHGGLFFVNGVDPDLQGDTIYATGTNTNFNLDLATPLSTVDPVITLNLRGTIDEFNNAQVANAILLTEMENAIEGTIEIQTVNPGFAGTVSKDYHLVQGSSPFTLNSSQTLIINAVRGDSNLGVSGALNSLYSGSFNSGQGSNIDLPLANVVNGTISIRDPNLCTVNLEGNPSLSHVNTYNDLTITAPSGSLTTGGFGQTVRSSGNLISLTSRDSLDIGAAVEALSVTGVRNGETLYTSTAGSIGGVGLSQAVGLSFTANSGNINALTKASNIIFTSQTDATVKNSGVTGNFAGTVSNGPLTIEQSGVGDLVVNLVTVSTESQTGLTATNQSITLDSGVGAIKQSAGTVSAGETGSVNLNSITGISGIGPEATFQIVARDVTATNTNTQDIRIENRLNGNNTLESFVNLSNGVGTSSSGRNLYFSQVGGSSVSFQEINADGTATLLSLDGSANMSFLNDLSFGGDFIAASNHDLSIGSIALNFNGVATFVLDQENPTGIGTGVFNNSDTSIFNIPSDNLAIYAVSGPEAPPNPVNPPLNLVNLGSLSDLATWDEMIVPDGLDSKYDTSYAAGGSYHGPGFGTNYTPGNGVFGSQVIWYKFDIDHLPPVPPAPKGSTSDLIFSPLFGINAWEIEYLLQNWDSGMLRMRPFCPGEPILLYAPCQEEVEGCCDKKESF